MGDLPRGLSVVIPEETASVNPEPRCAPQYTKLKELLAIPGLWAQVYAAFALSLASFGAGTVEGWPGTMGLKLVEPHPGIMKDAAGPITSNEISIIYLCMIVAALIHMCITGFILDRFGRKAGCWFLNFLAPSGWVFLATTNNVNQLYVGAAMIGTIAVSGETVGVVYLSEIADDRIRGPLISLLMFFNSLGILFAHVFGEELDFYTFHMICLCMSLVCPFFIWALPESPQYLMVHSRVEVARESVSWFHGHDQDVVEMEMKKLEKAKKFNLGECKTIWGQLSTRRSLLLTVGLFVMAELAGTSLIEVFAGTTLALIRNSPFSHQIASMILASCRFIGGILNVYLVERAGRIPSLKASLVKMAVCLFAVFCFLSSAKECSSNDKSINSTFPLGVPINSFPGINPNPIDDKGNRHPPIPEPEDPSSFYSVLCCFIFYTLSNQMYLGTIEVLSGEMLSADTKGAAMAFAGFARIVTLVLCIGLYNTALKLDPFAKYIFLFNMICCFVGGNILCHFTPETQGKTLNEIHKELAEGRFKRTKKKSKT